MAKFWTEILVPAAIVGLTLVQTVGVETHRAMQLDFFRPAADTTAVQADSQLTARPDSIVPALADSTALADSVDDFDFFGEEEPVDTTPRIDPRDTVKVPDSLRITDPFLYQWYVATKDTFVHRIVIDSLKAAGDSVIWPRIDSLFIADSTAAAIAAFNQWYASLTRAERRRYDYEQALPGILHRQDSIIRRKDSLKAVRDSIIENTPRILETAFLPDSLYYKRLVAWKHDRLYNRVEPFTWDTTANYRFYDYPFMKEDVGASWLGMPGSPVQNYNFFQRSHNETVSFYAPYDCWTYTPSSLPMFNTKTPYTELEYYGNLFTTSSKSADAFRVFTTQNITPALNIALEMRRWGGAGTLKNEKTDNRSYFVAGNYLGKQYLAHGGFIFNRVVRQENGGVQDNMWIRDTTVDVREIEVNLAAAQNRLTKHTLFFDQSYRIPMDFIDRIRHRGDSTWTPSDTLNKDITTAFIGTSSEWTSWTKQYVDQTSTPLAAFYNNAFFQNPAKSSDSLRVTRLDNRLFLRIQPWHEDAVVSRIEGGIGDRLQNHFLMQSQNYLMKNSPYRWNTAYVYAGAEGSLKKYLVWNANLTYNFAGYQANDFAFEANAKLNIYPFRRHPDSPMSFTARLESTLEEPEFYQQHFFSNHYVWENSFSKISTSKLSASLSVPRWRLNAWAGYSLLSGNIYYGTDGMPRQNGSAMSVISARLDKDFVLGPVHLDNSALVQFSSDESAMPLPLLALNLRWYLQLTIVDPKVMIMQIGANTRFTTAWYAPSYNPVAGVFMNQTEYKYGNCPVFDAFVNLQWKQACIFFKMENLGKGWPMDKHDYFTAHHYIQVPSIFKFGISWPIYPMLGQQRTMSSRAGSGMGGGGGASGGRRLSGGGGMTGGMMGGRR